MQRSDNILNDPAPSSVLKNAAIHPLYAFLWRLVVNAHLVAAGFWWWLMPGGFPPAHIRFWTNAAFPVTVAAVCVTCLWAEWRKNHAVRTAFSLTIPVFWLAATITAVVLFPHSARRFGIPAIGCLTIISIAFWLSARRQPILRRLATFTIVPAIGVAVTFVWAQRGGKPDTTPLNGSLPEFEPNVDIRLALIPARLADGVTVQTSDGRVQIRQGGVYKIDVESLLSFESRSPDRFWTILAPRRDRVSLPRQLKALSRTDLNLTAQYRDDTDAVLHVTTSATGDVVTIDGSTRLERPIYSHLNSYASFTIYGFQKPAVSFSPCAEVLVDVEPFDYPFGRPLRLTYVDAGDVFHVVRAKSGEKGPFVEFGSGRLTRADPLIITICDDKTPVFRITLADWAAQAGRDLSPTAGWGLPVNAIEFSQIGESDSGTGDMAIWVTLAGTSVGRGWDSVGHAAGTYRNRLTVESITRP